MITAFIPPKNLLLNPTLMIDSNADGKADNWVLGSLSAGITGVASISNGQKIEITGATSAGSYTAYQDVDVLPGKLCNVSVNYMISGSVIARVYIEWYNGTTFLSNSTLVTGSSGAFTKIDNLRLLSPTNTTKARIQLQVRANAAGNLGFVIFNYAKMWITQN